MSQAQPVAARGWAAASRERRGVSSPRDGGPLLPAAEEGMLVRQNQAHGGFSPLPSAWSGPSTICPALKSAAQRAKTLVQTEESGMRAKDGPSLRCRTPNNYLCLPPAVSTREWGRLGRALFQAQGLEDFFQKAQALVFKCSPPRGGGKHVRNWNVLRATTKAHEHIQDMQRMLSAQREKDRRLSVEKWTKNVKRRSS